MLNRVFFPRAPLCFLTESGELTDHSGAPARRRPGRSLVLSRARCQFRSFVAGPHVPKSQLARAARVFVEAHAPFADTGSVLLRTSYGAAVWYWDKSRIPDNVRARIVPEGMFCQPGQGWRVLGCLEGYEAQYWERGELLASTWRRRPFSNEQWAAFALSVDGATQSAPNSPPAPVPVRHRTHPSRRPTQIRAPWSWRNTERAAIIASLCCITFSGFFAGRGLRFEYLAKSEAVGLAAIDAGRNADTAIRRANSNLQLLRDYRAMMHVNDVPGASADAFEVFEEFGLDVEDWSADQQQFTAVLQVAVSEVPLRELVSALEAKPGLCNVTPRVSDGEAGVEISAVLSDPANEGACAPGLVREVRP